MFTRRIAWLILLLVFLSTTILTSPQSISATPSTNPAEVIKWNGIALRTITGISSGQAFVVIAYTQAAEYNAVVAIEGGFQPYALNLPPNPNASIDAAVATAAYYVLDHYIPAQHNALTTDYMASLAAVTDSPAKDMGIALGETAAEGIIALRAGDGYAVDIGFVMPAPGPGVWQLPAGVSPLTPWLSQMQPFMLLSADQFRPGLPPDLTSQEWAVEFNETKLIGKSDSPYRTQEQTNIARFWSSYPPVQYNNTFKALIISRGLDTMQASRLLAMGNIVGSDALIACFDAKYHYLFWRPFSSIPQADTDGNPMTERDPNWAPLLGTPPHPEYPSAHGCLTSATAEVLAEFLGTNHINIDVPSTIPAVFPNGRHFDSVNDLTKEIIDARVWAGIHYRESNIKGVTLGRKVAHWTLKRYFLPEE